MRLKNAIKSYFLSMVACLFVVTNVSGENIERFIIINNVGYDNSYSEQGNDEYKWLLKESRSNHGNFENVKYFDGEQWRYFRSGKILEQGYDGRYLLFNKDGKMEEVNESGENIKNLKVVSVGAQKDRIILTFNMMMRGMNIQKGSYYSVNGKVLDDEDIELDMERNRIYLNIGNIEKLNTIEVNNEAFRDYSIDFGNLKYSIVKIDNLNQIKDDGKIYALVNDNLTVSGEEVSGKLYIGGNDINIEGVKLNGDLVIDPGDKGNFTLSKGEIDDILVLSGGINSIHIHNSKVERVDIQSPMIRLAIENESEINSISVQTVALIESEKSNIKEVNIISRGYKKEEQTTLKGDFEKVVSSSGIKTVLDGVRIKELQLKVSPKVLVKSGQINEVEMHSEGTIEINDKAEVVDLYTNGHKVSIQGKAESVSENKGSNSEEDDDENNQNTGDEEFKGSWIRRNLFKEGLMYEIYFHGVSINGKMPDSYILKSKDQLDLSKKLSISDKFRILGILIGESYVEFYKGDQFLGKCRLMFQKEDIHGIFEGIKSEWSIKDSFEGSLTSDLKVDIKENSWNSKIAVYSGELLLGEISQKSGSIRSIKVLLEEVDRISIRIIDQEGNLVEKIYPRIESKLTLIK